MKFSIKSAVIGLFLISAILLFGSSCQNNTDNQYGVFQVIDDQTVEMDGEIGSSSLSDYNNLIQDYPMIEQIQIMEIGGSTDDEINLLLSKAVHDDDIAIHLEDDGLIASGGVDFFLAGTTRTKGENTKIGVHSWSDGINEATDFPEGHANHLPYINYYQSIGFTQEEAEAFYYFTIHAAPASDIHWMTDEEIMTYGILTP